MVAHFASENRWHAFREPSEFPPTWTYRSAGLLSCRRMRRAESAEQAFNRAMSESGKAQEKAYPLAGKVTIDGQTPKFTDRSYRLVVVLNDPDNLGVPATQRPHVEAKKNGEFAFSTIWATGRNRAGKIHRDLRRLRTPSQVRFHSAR